MPAEQEVLSFRVERKIKRLAKILAAQLDYDDVSQMMNQLLEREIAAHFTEAQIEQLLLDGAAPKKGKSARRA